MRPAQRHARLRLDRQLERDELRGLHGPDTALDFQLTAIGCDDDLCDVAGILHGDPNTGDTVTFVPKAGLVTVRAAGKSGSLVASGSVQVFANCTNTPDAPDCQ